MEDLPLGRIAALVPEFAAKDLPLGSSSGKALSYGLDGPGSIPGVGRGGDFSSLLRVQTGPEVHSASYKMSTGGFPRG